MLVLDPFAPVGPALSESWHAVGGPDELLPKGETLGLDGVADGDDLRVGAGLCGEGVRGATATGADDEDAGWGSEGFLGDGGEEGGDCWVG